MGMGAKKHFNALYNRALEIVQVLETKPHCDDFKNLVHLAEMYNAIASKKLDPFCMATNLTYGGRSIRLEMVSPYSPLSKEMQMAKILGAIPDIVQQAHENFDRKPENPVATQNFAARCQHAAAVIEVWNATQPRNNTGNDFYI